MVKKLLLASIFCLSFEVFAGTIYIDSYSYGSISIEGGKNDTLYEIEEEFVKIKVFPNPVTENTLFVTLNTEKNAIYTVKVYNLLGKVVALKEISKGNNSISLESLNEGIYFVDIAEGNKTIRSMKIIKR